MPNCVSCRHWFDDQRGTVCPRCEQDNTGWLKRSGARFLLAPPWGPLLLFSLIAPILGLVALLSAREGRVIEALNAVSSPLIGLVVGAIVCLVLLLVFNSVRDDLRVYYWARRLPGRGYRFSLPVLASIAFTLALVLGLVYTFVYKSVGGEGVIQPLASVSRLLLTIGLSLTFSNVTISAAMMCAYEYAKYINHLAPPPIFADKNTLMRVVLRDARTLILNATGRDEDKTSNSGEDFREWPDQPNATNEEEEEEEEEESLIHIELVEFGRTPDGGAKATLRHVWGPTAGGGDKQQGLWDIESDRWGRIQNMKRISSR
jgi:hypothetical protein